MTVDDAWPYRTIHVSDVILLKDRVTNKEVKPGNTTYSCVTKGLLSLHARHGPKQALSLFNFAHQQLPHIRQALDL